MSVATTNSGDSNGARPVWSGICQASLPGRSGRFDIAWEKGRITRVDSAQAAARKDPGMLDVDGCLVTPPFVDSHFHLDSVLSRGRPRGNASGTLREGIALWKEFKATLTEEDVFSRADRYCRWAVSRGIGAIRSHVDVSEEKLIAVKALLKVREAWRDRLDIQLVAFPQDGYLRDEQTGHRMAEALERGVDVVGGIPHGERTAEEGAESIRQLCRLAAEKGLQVDLHCDETDDPWSRHVETLARETIRYGLEGRVSGSHLTSLHSVDAAYARKVIGLMSEAGLHAIPNPLINITLQGRYDDYPKRRGLTRIAEMQEAGINVSLGHDCVLDPWYPLGSGDMLAVASMACHAGLMTRPEDFSAMFAAVTVNGAQTLGLKGYGLAAGCHADLVVLNACSEDEALRLSPERRWVFRRGEVVARQEVARCSQWFSGQEEEISFHFPRPSDPG